MKFYWDEGCGNYCLDYAGETYELEGTVSESSVMAWQLALADTLETLDLCVEAMKRFPQDDLDYNDALTIADYTVQTERTGNITRGEQ